MKGQAKRFLDHAGKAYDLNLKKTDDKNEDIGFLDLWRYASARERCATLCGAALAWASSLALIAAVLIYGELTALFVARAAARAPPPHRRLLALFGGARSVEGSSGAAHADALVEDAAAFALASVAVMCVQLAAGALAVWLADTAAAAMVNRLRLRLLRAVICQDMAFFDTSDTLNVAATLTEELERVRQGVGEHVAMTSYLAGTVVCGGALALAYGWQLTLAGLSVVPLSLLVAAVVAKYQTEWSAAEVSAYGAAGRVVEEALANIRTVRAYAGEDVEVERYAAALAPAAAAGRARGLWAGAGAGAGWLLTYSLNAIVFAYGSALCVRDMDLPPDRQEYHPGVMVTVLFCTFMAAQNITMCQPHLEIFSTARGAAKSVFRLLERKSHIHALDGGGLRPERFRGDIQFDDLVFAYPSRKDVKVLQGFTLKVSAGETVALVGGSGSGKSTVLQLLQRMYSPDSGSITIDGHRLQDLDLHHFRSKIGVVGQEPVLFAGTVRENIALGAGDVTDADIVAAAEIAHAHRFITELPSGYDTVLGCDGGALSGGQKQRLAIARAVLRRPALLLLDEPTSALDPAAEAQVQAALDAASAGRTTLVVSHRLATVRRATRIVCVGGGRVLQAGPPAALAAAPGPYRALLDADLSARIAEATPANDDDAPASDAFRRSTARHSTSTLRGSRSASLRGGRRACAAAARVPAAPSPDLLEHVADDEETGEASEADAGLWRLVRLQRPEWPLLALGGLAAFTVGATMPAFAYLFSKLYGMFSWSEAEAILAQSRVYAALFAACAALCGLVTFLQAWLLGLAGTRLTARLRRLCFRNYLRRDQTWFDDPTNSVGALCARLATDCAAVQGATGSRLGAVLQGVSTVVLGVGLAAAFSWKMTLVSLLGVPCVIGAIYLEGYASRRAEATGRRALESASRVATQAVLHVRTVQGLGAEREMLRRYGAELAAVRGGGAARAARAAVYGLCLCAPTLGYAVSLAYGGYLVAREGLRYEYAILVSEALIYGAWMLAEALSFAPSFAAARRSGARILAELEREPEPEVEGEGDAFDEGPGEVEFSEVEFSYPGSATRVLRGVSLRVAGGSSLALVGPSGGGKSTLLRLLLRDYEPTRGRVLLDGADVRRAAPRRLRARLGLVQQEPALFTRTLRENIAYGDNAREVPAAEVVRAAGRAGVHAFVAGLPLGYDTVASGAALSGGQKQRVALARALLREPRVLLLDEATSALDAASEQAVQAALEEAARGRTTIMVAHRLATVRHADTICVIDKGAVAEMGSHEELVARRGLYWRLLRQQGGA